MRNLTAMNPLTFETHRRRCDLRVVIARLSSPARFVPARSGKGRTTSSRTHSATSVAT